MCSAHITKSVRKSWLSVTIRHSQRELPKDQKFQKCVKSMIYQKGVELKTWVQPLCGKQNSWQNSWVKSVGKNQTENVGNFDTVQIEPWSTLTKIYSQMQRGPTKYLDNYGKRANKKCWDSLPDFAALWVKVYWVTKSSRSKDSVLNRLKIIFDLPDFSGFFCVIILMIKGTRIFPFPAVSGWDRHFWSFLSPLS